MVRSANARSALTHMREMHNTVKIGAAKEKGNKRVKTQMNIAPFMWFDCAVFACYICAFIHVRAAHHSRSPFLFSRSLSLSLLLLLLLEACTIFIIILSLRFFCSFSSAQIMEE